MVKGATVNQDGGITGKHATLAILRAHLQKTDEQLGELNCLRDQILKSISKLETILAQLEADAGGE